MNAEVSRRIRAAVGIFAALLVPASVAQVGGTDAAAPAVARFVDESDAAGVVSRYDGGWEFIVGGGAAAFDCNGDGLPDLLLAGGVNKARFYRNASAVGGPLRFVEQRSGLEASSVTGAYPLDIDGDGITDIVLLRVGEVILFRGHGDCTFERANEAWGFDGGNQWHTAFSATWEPGNAFPTLVIGTYIDRTQQEAPWGSCTPNRLYRPRPDRRPSAKGTNDLGGPIYGAPIVLSPGYCALSMLFSDWNRSGRAELRVSNDREYYKGGQEQLWHFAPGEVPRPYTEAEGWRPLQLWGMGIASAEVDGSGYPAFFLTSMADNKLQLLGGDPKRPSYVDSAFKRGVTAHRPYAGGDVRPSTAWHAQFEDVNNDGWPDLFIVKGNIGSMPDFAAVDPNNLLLGMASGKFVESGQQAGIAGPRRGRGGLLVDLNGDGLVDIVVVNHQDKAQVWRNVGGGSAQAPQPLGNWVAFRPQQDSGNRDAIGAWIELRTAGSTRVQRRELTVGGGHASGTRGWTHFGLGAEKTAEVRVLWPGMAVGDANAGWQPVEAGTRYWLRPGQTPVSAKR